MTTCTGSLFRGEAPWEDADDVGLEVVVSRSPLEAADGNQAKVAQTVKKVGAKSKVDCVLQPMPGDGYTAFL
eukprot:3827547-Amphidinium_carterae.1